MKYGLTLVLAVLISIPIAGAQSIVECTTINSPGYYILGNNIISNTEGSSCILITSGDVVIDGNGKTVLGSNLLGTGIEVLGMATLYNITIENITFQNLEEGIKLTNVENIQIVNNTFTYNAKSISLQESKSGIVADNLFENCGDFFSGNTEPIYGPGGILIDQSENVVVENNSFSKVMDDILLSNSKNIQVRGNLLYTGILIGGGALEYFLHEIDLSNTLRGKPIYYYKNSSRLTVPTNAGQVIIVNSSDMIIEGQKFNFTSVGAEIVFSSDIKIINSNFSYSRQGLLVFKSNRNVIRGNTFVYNKIAVIGSFNQSQIFFNNFSNNYCGIQFFDSYDNSIFLNDFIGNFHDVETNSKSRWNSTNKIGYMINGQESQELLGNYWEREASIDRDNNYINDYPYYINWQNSDFYPLVQKVDTYNIIEAKFDYFPSHPNVGTTILFDASLSLGKAIVSYEWDFDADGMYDQAGVVVEYAYDEPGDHVVSLKITTADGRTNVISKVISVSPRNVYILDDCSLIDSPGIYILDSDITYSLRSWRPAESASTKFTSITSGSFGATETCFLISSSDIIFDGNNHTIEIENFAKNNLSTIFVFGGKRNLENVTIKNLNITNNRFGAGIVFENATGGMIENVHVNHNGIGVDFDNSFANEVSSLTLSNNSVGFYLNNSFDNLISTLTVFNNFEGIILNNSEYNTIRNSTFYQNEDGIVLVSSNQNNIINNEFFDNYFSNVLIFDETNIEISASAKLLSLGSSDASSLPLAPVEFPYGIFTFLLKVEPGSTQNIKINVYDDYGNPVTLDENTEYWKYTFDGAGNPSGEAGWYNITSEISGNTISFYVTDGGIGDADGEVNGFIYDPGGPAIRVNSGGQTEIPEFNPIGLFGAALVILIFLRIKKTKG